MRDPAAPPSESIGGPTTAYKSNKTSSAYSMDTKLNLPVEKVGYLNTEKIEEQKVEDTVGDDSFFSSSDRASSFKSSNKVSSDLRISTAG